MRLAILCAAVLVHSVATAATCDELRQELNQAVTDGKGDGYLCVSYTERFGGNGTNGACIDYTDAMWRITFTVQELQERGCWYRIAPADAKYIARIYAQYARLTTP